MRFIAAQFDALLRDRLWLENAAHANSMARRLADRVVAIPSIAVPRPPAVNSIFATLPPTSFAALQDWSFFWIWDPAERLVCWMTQLRRSPE